MSMNNSQQLSHGKAEQKTFVKNVSWTSLTMVLRVLFAGGALAILGRLVDPATMGLYGMGWAAAMLGFTISQSGAAQGIIALRKLDKEHVAAAQLLSALISIAIAAIIILAAPAVEAFYHYPKLAVAFVIAGLFVPLMSLSAVDVALAQKELQFSRLAVVQTGAVMLAAITSLILARLGHGLIALYALQGLVGPFTFVLFRCYRGSPGFGLTSRRHVADVWRIGMHLSLGSLTGVIWQSVPQLVLARMVSVEALGLYVFCYRIIQVIFSQLSNMVNTVVYPTFARDRSDPGQVGRAYLQTVRFTYFCLMLPLIALAAAPGSFLRFYGGGQWAAADGIMFYLVLMQMSVSLGANAFPTFMALGRPEVAWQWNLFITLVQSVAILVTASWGIIAVVQGLAVSSLVMPLAVFWLSKVAQFRFLDYWRNMASLIGFIAPAIALGAGIEHLLGKIPVMLRFMVSSLAATLLYVTLVLATDSQAKRFFLDRARSLRSFLSLGGVGA
jgi:O-antigen/teichoic acid export membrane protein